LAALAKIKKPDAWNLATMAEASLGTGDWSTISDALVRYTNAPDVTAFHIESTLRQFQELWRLQDDPRGKPLLAILRAFMMKMPDAKLELSAKQVAQRIPDAAQFEATLGKIKGSETRAWWLAGLEQGKGVASIRQKLAGRIGTGFLVRAKSIGLDHLDENLVLTNFHVVNKDGVPIGLAPQDVEVAFEAVDPDARYEIAEVLCESPPTECDFCLLRLARPVKNPTPLTVGRALPALQADPPQPQVFVIGHPLGKELTYSFQDNEIIDHEGPAAGKPPNPASCRVHYRAPTEKGNSGSPVFNSLWQVVALHHAGGKSMPKLNGQAGEQAANEGIWLQSIIELIRGRMAPALKGAA
jgi:S1-C subfamily serine protease